MDIERQDSLNSQMVRVESDLLRQMDLGRHFKITPHGLMVRGSPSFEVFDVLGEKLRALERSLQFVVGDFFREVKGRFGERASQILDHVGWSEETLRVYRWTAQNVALEDRRMDVLTYTHHQLVAHLPSHKQRHWLEQAASGSGGHPWSVRQLRRAMRAVGDDGETAWWVIVRADSQAHQDEIVAEFQAKGLDCKPIQRHSTTRGAWGTEVEA